MHLSEAPKPWDDKLGNIFKVFWNHHLLSWLERQWCLKDLHSCLVILSEGQELHRFVCLAMILVTQPLTHVHRYLASASTKERKAGSGDISSTASSSKKAQD
jgi:hypothetical protein